MDGYAKTPGTWDDKPNSMVMWLNVNGYYSDAQGWWLTGLTVKDVTEAQGAQLTADGKNRTYTSQTEPAHAGLTPGDVWYRQDDTGNVVGVMVWDGSRFNRMVVMADQLLVPGSLGPISMADGSVTAVKIKADEAMLKKLLVRKLLADEIDVGSLAAAIIQSDRFVTKDGLNGLDESGFWTKDKDGNILFKTSDGLVQAVGGWQTASKGDRIQLSQTLIQGTNTGGLQGIGDDPKHPYWLIWGDHDGASSRLMMGTSPQQPQYAATIGSDGRKTASMAADQVDIVGSRIMVGYRSYTPHIDVPLYQWIDFYPGFSDYVGRTRLDIAGGMCNMTIAVQGNLPDNTYTPVAHVRRVYPHAGLNVVCTLQYAYAAGAFIGSDTDPDPQVINVMNHSGGTRTWAVAQFIFPYDGQLD